MNLGWKKTLAALLSWVSFIGSLISLAVFLYWHTHPEWIGEPAFTFLGWLILIAALSGVIAFVLVIMFHMPDMEVYVFLSIFGIILSIFIFIPVDIGYSLAHTPIG